jgi:hypothetical protein
MYGAGADRLFEVIEPVLKTTDFMQGAEVQLRYGPPRQQSRGKNGDHRQGRRQLS